MRSITLIENLVYKQGLIAEHGLSVYIETDHKKILFDTGQTDNFIKNANALGIDLTHIDHVVISHGHYDHTGGLKSFLEINQKATVYIKKEAFAQKHHGAERYIGIHQPNPIPAERMVYVNKTMEIDTGLFIIPEIEIHYPIDTHYSGMSIKTNNDLIKDEFQDELFLVYQRNHQINIFTACSHRGITNICQSAVSQFHQPVNLISGGFHTQKSTPEQIRHIADYMNQLNPKKILTCHCTGIEQYTQLHQQINTSFSYNYTGNEVIIT